MLEDLNRENIARHFGRLGKLLACRLLPTEAGGGRLAGVDEFMLMYAEDGVAYFKHRDSRNYVHLKSHDGTDYLKIPDDGRPFHRGTFDVFEVPAGRLSAAMATPEGFDDV